MKRVYAAITSVHFTEPQVRQGGKVSVFESGILDFSPFSLQKCAYNPDVGHFSPVRKNLRLLVSFAVFVLFFGLIFFLTANFFGFFFSGIYINQSLDQ